MVTNKQILAIEGAISRVEEEIARVEAKLEMGCNGDAKEIKYLRREKEQLRREKEQLRRKEEQLRAQKQEEKAQRRKAREIKMEKLASRGEVGLIHGCC